MSFKRKKASLNEQFCIKASSAKKRRGNKRPGDHKDHQKKRLGSIDSSQTWTRTKKGLKVTSAVKNPRTRTSELPGSSHLFFSEDQLRQEREIKGKKFKKVPSEKNLSLGERKLIREALSPIYYQECLRQVGKGSQKKPNIKKIENRTYGSRVKKGVHSPPGVGDCSSSIRQNKRTHGKEGSTPRERILRKKEEVHRIPKRSPGKRGGGRRP